MPPSNVLLSLKRGDFLVKKANVYFLLVLFLFLAILFVLLYQFSDKDQFFHIDDGKLSITSISLPGQMYGLKNRVEFPNTDIIYLYNSSDITIELNKPVDPNGKYNFYFFQGGSYVPIVNELYKKKGDYYYYRIEENIIKIYGYENIFPGGFVIIHIPESLTSDVGSKLSQSMKLILSPNELTPHLKLEWVNQVDREKSSLVIPINKQTEVKVGYVIKNSIPLLKEDKEKTYLNLFRGESFYILQEDRDYYKIVVFLSTGKVKNQMDADSDVYKEPYVERIEGFVKKQDVTTLPKPLNEGTIYAVNHSDDYISEEIQPGTHLIVLTPLIGKTEVYLPTDMEPAQPSYFHSLESITLWQWLDMLPGSNYWSSYSDESGNPISKLDESSHHQERSWSKEQYETYLNAREEYSKYLIEKFSSYKVANAYEEYKKSIFPEQIRKRLQLQDIWVDWGYSDRNLDPSWFFEQILTKFNLDKKDRDKFSTLFNSSKTDTEDQFNEKLGTFINSFIIHPLTGETIQKTLDQFTGSLNISTKPNQEQDYSQVDNQNNGEKPKENDQELTQMLVVLTKKIQDDVWEVKDDTMSIYTMKVLYLNAAPELSINKSYSIGAIKAYDDELGKEVLLVEGDLIRPMSEEEQ